MLKRLSTNKVSFPYHHLPPHLLLIILLLKKPQLFLLPSVVTRTLPCGAKVNKRAMMDPYLFQEVVVLLMECPDLGMKRDMVEMITNLASVEANRVVLVKVCLLQGRHWPPCSSYCCCAYAYPSCSCVHHTICPLPPFLPAACVPVGGTAATLAALRLLCVHARHGTPRSSLTSFPRPSDPPFLPLFLPPVFVPPHCAPHTYAHKTNHRFCWCYAACCCWAPPWTASSC